MSDRESPVAPDGLVGRAESLVPLLRANAARAEQLRHIPDDSVRALEEAGLFRMTRPVCRGGYGTDATTISKVMTSIASGCASTTWVMMIYSSVGERAELLSDEALAEIYASPHPKIAGVFAKSGAVVERVEGGSRARGRALVVQQRVRLLRSTWRGRSNDCFAMCTCSNISMR
jgi:3-hydroxy-9,10-secoandrosta-1,3,5(10)-triene-9,17-dione monooxygenase